MGEGGKMSRLGSLKLWEERRKISKERTSNVTYKQIDDNLNFEADNPDFKTQEAKDIHKRLPNGIDQDIIEDICELDCEYEFLILLKLAKRQDPHKMEVHLLEVLKDNENHKNMRKAFGILNIDEIYEE